MPTCSGLINEPKALSPQGLLLLDRCIMTAVNMTISFAKNVGAFSPGEEIFASLNVEVTHQIKPTLVSARIEGVASVKNESRDVSGDAELAYRSEVYIDEEKCLYNVKELELPDLFKEAESHSFDFNFKLPENIPSSFEFQEGFIRYSLTCKLEGFNIAVYTVKKYFTVNAVVNLNDILKSQRPATAVVTRNGRNCWMCMRSRNLEAAVQTPRRGYVPGEVITINAEVNNRDSRPIGCVSARLIQVVKSHGKNWPKKFKRVVAEVTRGYILANSSQYWLEESMLIPPVVSSYLEHCKLIDVKYKIYFRISRDGAQEVTLKLPIIIGNVPLCGVIDIIQTNDEQSDSQSERGVQAFEPCYFGPHVVTERGDDGKQTTNEEITFSPFYVTFASS